MAKRRLVTRGVWPCVLLALAAVAGSASAETRGWRGDGSSVFPAARPVERWWEDDRALWSAATSASSHASAVVVGGRVFLTEEPTTLTCLDATSGRTLWRHSLEYADTLPASEALAGRERARAIAAELSVKRRKLDAVKRRMRRGDGDEQAMRRELETLGEETSRLRKEMETLARFLPPTEPRIIGNASATPVTDGHVVYAVFGTGVVAAVDVDGGRRWTVWVGDPAEPMLGLRSGHAASPRLAEGKLVVGLGTLMALDPATGRVLWRDAQPYDDFGTPAIARSGKTTVVITPSGDVLRLADGKAMARDVGLQFYSSPVVAGDRVFFAGLQEEEGYGDAVSVARAVRLKPGAERTVEAETVWTAKLEPEEAYASPLLFDGLLYTLSYRGALEVFAADDGTSLYRRKIDLPGFYYPSLAQAGDRIYILSDQGSVLAIRPGPAYREIGRGAIDCSSWSTPFFEGERVYHRCRERLYCFGAGR